MFTQFNTDDYFNNGGIILRVVKGISDLQGQVISKILDSTKTLFESIVINHKNGIRFEIDVLGF